MYGLTAPLEGEIVGGRFRIDRMIGSGATGLIFAVTDTLNGNGYALKWMPVDPASPDRAQRFVREAETNSKIRHPNVVEVYDVGWHEGAVVIVMERLVGVPLSAMMSSGALDYEQALMLLLPAIRGVAAAHALGFVHRDIKPENIFVCYDETGEVENVKVLDFGISKFTRQDPSEALTAVGTVLGTPLYMSTEQLRAVPDIDGRTDQYALACVLYELVEGVPAFIAPSLPQITALKIQDKPRAHLFNDMPPGFWEVVYRGMSHARENRYDSVADFGRALDAFSAAKFDASSMEMRLDDATFLPDKKPVEVRESQQRKKMYAIMAAVAVVSLCLFTGLLSWAFSDDEETVVPVVAAPVAVPVVVLPVAMEAAMVDESPPRMRKRTRRRRRRSNKRRRRRRKR